MECFVIGVVATGFFVRSIIKATQSWDGLARNLGYKKVEPFRLEGQHNGLRVVIERIPGQKKGTQTTEVRIQTMEGWPTELIIHSQAPRSGLMPFVPSGTMQKIDSALFALRYVVLNVPISKEIGNRILGLPGSDLLYATKDEIRFVFTNKSYPAPVEIRKLLFQLHTIMKKTKSSRPASTSKSSASLPKSSFMNVDYSGLLNTLSHQAQEPSILSSAKMNTTPTLLEEVEESYDYEDSLEEHDTPEDDVLSYEEDDEVDSVPAVIQAPSSKEEHELVDFHKALGEFGVTSLARESLIQKCTVSTLHVEIEDIRPTFELGMPDGYKKGVTVFGLAVGVPVCVYIPQRQKSVWMDRKRGEEYNLSVRVYRYDVLRKRLVFLSN